MKLKNQYQKWEKFKKRRASTIDEYVVKIKKSRMNSQVAKYIKLQMILNTLAKNF